jgi:hypothetical protein
VPLADWQFQLGSLVMGEGTKYVITNIDGLGMAPVNNNDLSLLGDGVFAGRDSQAGRQVIFTVNVADVPGSAFATTFGAFVDAWQQTNTDADLTWKVAGITNLRKLTGRPRRLAVPYDGSFGLGFAVVVAEFFCPVPYIKDATTLAVVRY